jgi:hypothetical protein
MPGAAGIRVHLRPKLKVYVYFRGRKFAKLSAASTVFMERAMGIEPTSEAWEAWNKNLKALELAGTKR